MTKRIIIAVLIVLAAQLTATWFLIRSREHKVVYADAIRLFNEYKFKLDLEKVTAGQLNRLKLELDSVGVIYKTDPANERAQQLIAQKQQQFSEAYNAINKDINTQVWNRLNPVIQQFGKDKGIELMVGANGMGTVLYASEARDITGDLIKYANEVYEKGN